MNLHTSSVDEDLLTTPWRAGVGLVSLLAIALALMGLASCTRAAQTVDRVAYADEITQWQAKRLTDLKRDDGYLTLVGLFWLKEGENRFGSDLGNDIVVPSGKVPGFAGSIRLEGTGAKISVSPGVEMTSQGKPVVTLDLRSDADSAPTVLELGSLNFHLIRRGDKTGLRVRDKEHPARANFPGLKYFPIEERWRVVARFEPYSPPKTLPIMNVLGMESNESSPGALSFEIDNRTYRLEPIVEKGESQFFIIFADQTKGKETYGAGRYLYADPPDASGRVIVDFNKAYNPPCAFTNFATCPLPPEQNRLPIRIEAGEKYERH